MCRLLPSYVSRPRPFKIIMYFSFWHKRCSLLLIWKWFLSYWLMCGLFQTTCSSCLSIETFFFIFLTALSLSWSQGGGWSLSQQHMGEGRVHTWMSPQFIAGPLLAVMGFVPCSRVRTPPKCLSIPRLEPRTYPLQSSNLFSLCPKRKPLRMVDFEFHHIFYWNSADEITK